MANANQPVTEFIKQSSVFHERIRSIYEPLDPNLAQIRLMHILPGELEDERIEVILSIVNLENGPVYDAISYTWDSLVPTMTIHLCDTPYEITTNQYAALRRLRLADEQRTIWMDVTCINQADLVERGCQVSIMGQIYANATQTRIWLGEPQLDWSDITDHDWDAHVTRLNSDSEQLSYMTRCARQIPAETMSAFMGAVTVGSDGILTGALHVLKLLADGVHIRYLPYCRVDADGKVEHCRPFYHVLEMLLSLFQRPWWTRVWVLQEACLSKTIPVVHVGGQQTSIRTFTDARPGWMDSWKDWQRDDRLLGEVYDLQAFIAAMARVTTYGNALETIGRKFGRLNLPIGLDLVNERNAGDRRDFVYGIMSVIQEDNRIPIDYSLDVGQVFSLASWHTYVEYAAGFDMLKEAVGTASTDIPSWAIDWGRRDEAHFADSNLFEAREEIDEDLVQCFHLDGVLQLTGNKIDVIQAVLETSESLDLSVPDEALDTILNWVHHLHVQGVLTHTDLGANDPEAIKAFFTTLFRDTKTDQHGKMTRFVSDNDWREIFDWFKLLRLAADTENEDLKHQAGASQICVDFRHATRGSCLCVTGMKRLCLGRIGVEAGDILYHIRGCCVPLALRAGESRSLQWVEEDEGPQMERSIDPLRVVGPCYMTGTMGLDGADRAAEQVLYLV